MRKPFLLLNSVNSSLGVSGNASTSQVKKEMAEEGPSSATGSSPHPKKEEVDSRSIYVGNLNYQCTSEEVKQYFEVCGLVERVTILEDKRGSKGFAFVEFSNTEAVENALSLYEPELCGRLVKVSAKQTYRRPMRRRASSWSRTRWGTSRLRRLWSHYRPY